MPSCLPRAVPWHDGPRSCTNAMPPRPIYPHPRHQPLSGRLAVLTEHERHQSHSHSQAGLGLDVHTGGKAELSEPGAETRRDVADVRSWASWFRTGQRAMALAVARHAVLPPTIRWHLGWAGRGRARARLIVRGPALRALALPSVSYSYSQSVEPQSGRHTIHCSQEGNTSEDQSHGAAHATTHPAVRLRSRTRPRPPGSS